VRTILIVYETGGDAREGWVAEIPVDQRAALLRSPAPVLDAVGRMNSAADLTASLQSVIEGIIEATGFGAGAIDYVRPDGTMQIVAVAGPPGAKESLLGEEVPPGALAHELEPAERWGRLRFLPHGTVPNDVPYVWTPDLPLPDSPDGWHPDDCLLAPLYAVSGELIGVLSVDMPVDGLRPDAFQRQLLELLAGQAETALQNARGASRLQASEESFRLAFEGTAVGMGLISLDHRRPLRLLQSNRALGRIAEAR
jgi:GAF domain-containing protein